MTIRKYNLWVIEIVLIFLIFGATLFPYLHMYVPQVNEFSFFNLRFVIDQYPNAQILSWVCVLKLSFLSLFTLWFFTSDKIWRYAVLTLSTFTLYQFISILWYEFVSVKEASTYLIVNPRCAWVLILFVFICIWLDKKIKFKERNLLELAHIYPESMLSYKRHDKKKYKKRKKIVNQILINVNSEPASSRMQKMILALKRMEVNTLVISQQGSNNLFREILTGVFILSLIPVYYVSYLVPEDATSIDFAFFSYASSLITNARVFAFLFMMKFIPLIGITIWYFTNWHWWKYALLVPFIILTFQILQLFNDNVSQQDEHEIRYALPILIPLLIFMIWISTKIKYYAATYDLHDALEKELKKLTRKLSGSEQDREDLKVLIQKKDQYSSEEYLLLLNELKKKLENNKR